MSRPFIDSLYSDSVLFDMLVTRTQKCVTWEVWEDIMIRMTIRAADQACGFTDIIENVRSARHV